MRKSEIQLNIVVPRFRHSIRCLSKSETGDKREKYTMKIPGHFLRVACYRRDGFLRKAQIVHIKYKYKVTKRKFTFLSKKNEFTVGENPKQGEID